MEKEYTIVDGYKIDAETGEVLEYIPPKPGFSVKDEDSADWVLKKILEADNEIQRIEARYQELIRTANSKKQRLIEWFEPQLKEYAKQHVSDKVKSLKLFYGTLSFRTVPERIHVDAKDEELVESVKRYFPECIKVKEEVSLKELDDDKRRALLEKHVSGVTVLPEEERFYIKP